MLRNRNLISRVLCHIVRTSSSKPALFCTTTNVQPSRLSCWDEASSSSQVILKKKLETALNDQRVDDAWDIFKDFKRLYGLPDNADVLTKLSLSLAKAQMPEPTCTILRTMLERNYVLTSDVLRVIVSHMVTTEVGTCLASNYLIQVCDHFLRSSSSNESVMKKKKPDTFFFNLVLNSCVRFGFSLKGQELIELMAKVDVIADAYSIVIMSFIYEMNGMRDELRKLKDVLIGQVKPQLICHYQPLFDNLLSLEFKFDDFNSSAIELCKNKDDLFSPVQDLGFRVLGSDLGTLVLPLVSGLKIQISPNLLVRDEVDDDNSTQTSFVNYVDNKTLAKLVYRCKSDDYDDDYYDDDDDSELAYRYRKKEDASRELTNLLFSLGGTKLVNNVIDACVAIGWSQAAYDILVDMYCEDRIMELATFRKVLSRCLKSEMAGEASILLRYMHKYGLITDYSDEYSVAREYEEKEEDDKESREFKDLLIQEIKEGEKQKMKVVPSKLYELNSSLYNFCKAKMVEDAYLTYREIQLEIRISPTRQSYWILIDMYSSLGMYREIKEVWEDDIKWYIGKRNLKVSQDLLEKIVVNLIRGGYFEKVLEVINYMKENDMYNDFIMYKNEYLETQVQKVEHVKAFRKLVGL